MTLLNIYELLLPMCWELSSFGFFLLGFLFLRMDDLFFRSKIRKVRGKPKKVGNDASARPQAQLHKSLQADLSAGNAKAALCAWRAGQRHVPTPVESLKVVAEAFLKAEPERLSQEIVEHIQTHKEVLYHSRTVTAVLDTIANAGNIFIMEEFAALANSEQGLKIAPAIQTYEVLLGAHSAAGDEPRVRVLLAEASSVGLRITPRAYALTIKGFLKRNMADAALQQILDMQMAHLRVPTLAVVQLCRAACALGRSAEIFDVLCQYVQVPADAVALLLDDAFNRNDLQCGLHVEKRAREAKVQFVSRAYESLLKLCIVNADVHAFHVFEDMQSTGIHISDRLCVFLLARCAESKFLRFAEVIAEFVRSREGMTISVYSSLMKCYAYCGMYDKACDLYDQIRGAGLEPDAMMYGCLMKFAVECGRTELSRQLAEKAPSLDIQNYMSLIRAAGRDKDVARAFSLLKELESSGSVADIHAYSCVLDACVSAGDMKQARSLFEEIKNKFGSLDIITFNTLLKGYCSACDITGAKALLQEMTTLGFPPNDVSFNCLINAAVSVGDFTEAWQSVDMMEKSGIAVDAYTICIMLKPCKRTKNMKYVNQVLDLLDRVRIDVCSDEVLFKTVLETCIRHNMLHRLDMLLQAFGASTLQPCVHSYGLLIKAWSLLKRVDRCWEFWQTMVQHRGMRPNDIGLGCMLNALVCNNKVEDAVALFREWKDVVQPNTILYSILLKGFANTHQAARAMEMWQEMRLLSLPMNSVVYHALIDAQARVGAMDKVTELVEDMTSNGCRLDAISYSTIVKGYCVSGAIDKAFAVFHDMQANSIGNDCVIYNVVLDGCTRHKRMDLADLVIADMDKFGIKPSVFTLGILVKMYGRRGELEKAFEVLDLTAQKHGIRPNLQVKTCLMCACLYNHDFDKAFAVFEDLKATERGADAKVYSALISGILRNSTGRTFEAVELVREAYGLKASAANGHVMPSAPGVETQALEQLFQALGAQGLMEKVGKPLIEQLRAAHLPISGGLLSRFLGGGR